MIIKLLELSDAMQMKPSEVATWAFQNGIRVSGGKYNVSDLENYLRHHDEPELASLLQSKKPAVPMVVKKVETAWCEAYIYDTCRRRTRDKEGIYLLIRYKITSGAFKGRIASSRFDIQHTGENKLKKGLLALDEFKRSLNLEDSRGLVDLQLEIQVTESVEGNLRISGYRPAQQLENLTCQQAV